MFAASAFRMQYMYNSQKKTENVPSMFKINRGQAIDVLQHDYPLIFTKQPDLSIFTDTCEFHDFLGKRLKNKNQYERMFHNVRWIRNTLMNEADISYRFMTVENQCIRIRWGTKIQLESIFYTNHSFYLDGISCYHLDSNGKIYKHVLKMCSDIPCDMMYTSSKITIPSLSYSFKPNLLLVMQESPMERAIRERQEDFEKERVLNDRRRSKVKKLDAICDAIKESTPEFCENSFDCDYPQICCDLFVVSVCCTPGSMIPIPDSKRISAQMVPIPIPIDDDDIIKRGNRLNYLPRS